MLLLLLTLNSSMKRTYIYTIDKKTTIKNYLQQKGYSKHSISFLKLNENSILVNKKKQYTNYLLNENDILEITFSEDKDESYFKQTNILPEIIYQDDDILVVNKPAFMLTHNSRSNDTISLAESIYGYDRDIVCHFITRLDKETSGLVLIAKNRYVCDLLSKQKINKLYYALVKGQAKSQIIEAPLLKENNKMVVNEKGLKAITEMSLIKYYDISDVSLIECKLLTGRTHQIRAHCNYIGLPIIGDKIYGCKSNTVNRQALHCHSISFIHPITNTPMQFEIGLANDLKILLESI